MHAKYVRNVISLCNMSLIYTWVYIFVSWYAPTSWHSDSPPTTRVLPLQDSIVRTGISLCNAMWVLHYRMSFAILYYACVCMVCMVYIPSCKRARSNQVGASRCSSLKLTPFRSWLRLRCTGPGSFTRRNCIHTIHTHAWYQMAKFIR